MTTRLTHPTHTEPISRLTAALHGGEWTRYANALLGLWLFISAFAWDHAPSSRMNTALVGLFMLVSAMGDVRVNQACRSPIDVSVRVEFPKLNAGLTRGPAPTPAVR